MKKLLLLLSLTYLPLISFSQDISCDELLDYVESKGYSKGSVGSFTLAIEGSSWLKEVEAYSVENTIVVVAEIKRDELGFSSDKYVFCGVPNSNWSNFKNGFSDLGMSYGERFHKYIFDYKCNCN